MARNRKCCFSEMLGGELIGQNRDLKAMMCFGIKYYFRSKKNNLSHIEIREMMGSSLSSSVISVNISHNFTSV
jgi:hypothetical protein